MSIESDGLRMRLTALAEGVTDDFEAAAEAETRLGQLERVRAAASEFLLAHQLWMEIPENVPSDDPERDANASGALDATEQELGIALAAFAGEDEDYTVSSVDLPDGGSS